MHKTLIMGIVAVVAPLALCKAWTAQQWPSMWVACASPLLRHPSTARAISTSQETDPFGRPVHDITPRYADPDGLLPGETGVRGQVLVPTGFSGTDFVVWLEQRKKPGSVSVHGGAVVAADGSFLVSASNGLHDLVVSPIYFHPEIARVKDINCDGSKRFIDIDPIQVDVGNRVPTKLQFELPDGTVPRGSCFVLSFDRQTGGYVGRGSYDFGGKEGYGGNFLCVDAEHRVTVFSVGCYPLRATLDGCSLVAELTPAPFLEVSLPKPLAERYRGESLRMRLWIVDVPGFDGLDYLDATAELKVEKGTARLPTMGPGHYKFHWNIRSEDSDKPHIKGDLDLLLDEPPYTVILSTAGGRK